MKCHSRLSRFFRSALRFGAPLAVAFLVGCSGVSAPQDNPDHPTFTQCVNPRPQVCTHDYRPVCGESEDGTTKTYGNACGACSHQTVIGHRPGECQAL
jgi:hypothetical protein